MISTVSRTNLLLHQYQYTVKANTLNTETDRFFDGGHLSISNALVVAPTSIVEANTNHDYLTQQNIKQLSQNYLFVIPVTLRHKKDFIPRCRILANARKLQKIPKVSHDENNFRLLPINHSLITTTCNKLNEKVLAETTCKIFFTSEAFKTKFLGTQKAIMSTSCKHWSWSAIKVGKLHSTQQRSSRKQNIIDQNFLSCNRNGVFLTPLITIQALNTTGLQKIYVSQSHESLTNTFFTDKGELNSSFSHKIIGDLSPVLFTPWAISFQKKLIQSLSIQKFSVGSIIFLRLTEANKGKNKVFKLLKTNVKNDIAKLLLIKKSLKKNEKKNCAKIIQRNKEQSWTFNPLLHSKTNFKNSVVYRSSNKLHKQYRNLTMSISMISAFLLTQGSVASTQFDKIILYHPSRKIIASKQRSYKAYRSATHKILFSKRSDMSSFNENASRDITSDHTTEVQDMRSFNEYVSGDIILDTTTDVQENSGLGSVAINQMSLNKTISSRTMLMNLAGSKVSARNMFLYYFIPTFSTSRQELSRTSTQFNHFSLFYSRSISLLYTTMRSVFVIGATGKNYSNQVSSTVTRDNWHLLVKSLSYYKVLSTTNYTYRFYNIEVFGGKTLPSLLTEKMASSKTDTEDYVSVSFSSDQFSTGEELSGGFDQKQMSIPVYGSLGNAGIIGPIRYFNITTIKAKFATTITNMIPVQYKLYSSDNPHNLMLERIKLNFRSEETTTKTQVTRKIICQNNYSLDEYAINTFLHYRQSSVIDFYVTTPKDNVQTRAYNLKTFEISEISSGETESSQGKYFNFSHAPMQLDTLFKSFPSASRPYPQITKEMSTYSDKVQFDSNAKVVATLNPKRAVKAFTSLANLSEKQSDDKKLSPKVIETTVISTVKTFKNDDVFTKPCRLKDYCKNCNQTYYIKEVCDLQNLQTTAAFSMTLNGGESLAYSSYFSTSISLYNTVNDNLKAYLSSVHGNNVSATPKRLNTGNFTFSSKSLAYLTKARYENNTSNLKFNENFFGDFVSNLSTTLWTVFSKETLLNGLISAQYLSNNSVMQTSVTTEAYESSHKLTLKSLDGTSNNLNDRKTSRCTTCYESTNQHLSPKLTHYPNFYNLVLDQAKSQIFTYPVKTKPSYSDYQAKKEMVTNIFLTKNWVTLTYGHIETFKFYVLSNFLTLGTTVISKSIITERNFKQSTIANGEKISQETSTIASLTVKSKLFTSDLYLHATIKSDSRLFTHSSGFRLSVHDITFAVSSGSSIARPLASNALMKTSFGSDLLSLNYKPRILWNKTTTLRLQLFTQESSKSNFEYLATLRINKTTESQLNVTKSNFKAPNFFSGDSKLRYIQSDAKFFSSTKTLLENKNRAFSHSKFMFSSRKNFITTISFMSAFTPTLNVKEIPQYIDYNHCSKQITQMLLSTVLTPFFKSHYNSRKHFLFFDSSPFSTIVKSSNVVSDEATSNNRLFDYKSTRNVPNQTSSNENKLIKSYGDYLSGSLTPIDTQQFTSKLSFPSIHRITGDEFFTTVFHTIYSKTISGSSASWMKPTNFVEYKSKNSLDFVLSSTSNNIDVSSQLSINDHTELRLHSYKTSNEYAIASTKRECKDLTMNTALPQTKPEKTNVFYTLSPHVHASGSSNYYYQIANFIYTPSLFYKQKTKQLNNYQTLSHAVYFSKRVISTSYRKDSNIVTSTALSDTNVVGLSTSSSQISTKFLETVGFRTKLHSNDLVSSFHATSARVSFQDNRNKTHNVSKAAKNRLLSFKTRDYTTTQITSSLVKLKFVTYNVYNTMQPALSYFEIKHVTPIILKTMDKFVTSLETKYIKHTTSKIKKSILTIPKTNASTTKFLQAHTKLLTIAPTEELTHIILITKQRTIRVLKTSQPLIFTSFKIKPATTRFFEIIGNSVKATDFETTNIEPCSKQETSNFETIQQTKTNILANTPFQRAAQRSGENKTLKYSVLNTKQLEPMFSKSKSTAFLLTSLKTNHEVVTIFQTLLASSMYFETNKMPYADTETRHLVLNTIAPTRLLAPILGKTEHATSPLLKTIRVFVTEFIAKKLKTKQTLPIFLKTKHTTYKSFTPTQILSTEFTLSFLETKNHLSTFPKSKQSSFFQTILQKVNSLKTIYAKSAASKKLSLPSRDFQTKLLSEAYLQTEYLSQFITRKQKNTQNTKTPSSTRTIAIHDIFISATPPKATLSLTSNESTSLMNFSKNEALLTSMIT